MSADMGAVFAFACGINGREGSTTINHRTAGKARYSYLLDLRDVYSKLKFADIRVRKLGPPVTSEAFARCARYRGLPELRCGDRVELREGMRCGMRGVVVGHDDSANFDVLFDDDSEAAG